MPTTRETTGEEKPAKPRPRSRKAAESRKAKAAARAPTVLDQVTAEVEPIGVAMAQLETDVVDHASIDETPVDETPAQANTVEVVPVTVAMEKAQEAVLTGEVLPPEVRDAARQAAGLSDIALAYGDYTRTSWANGRFLTERLIAARSLGEVIEIHGEFAKQACANFITQSQRISVLYGEWAQQFFRSWDKFAMPWQRIGRSN